MNGIGQWIKSPSLPHCIKVDPEEFFAHTVLLPCCVFSILCFPSEIRLVNGSGFCSGRVEVLHNEEWGTICDNGWGIEEAQVICKGLSCGSALKARSSAWFGKGMGRIWLDEVTCEGTEKSLYDCPSRPWGSTDCNHKNDAGIECAGNSQLVLHFEEK